MKSTILPSLLLSSLLLAAAGKVSAQSPLPGATYSAPVPSSQASAPAPGPTNSTNPAGIPTTGAAPLPGPSTQQILSGGNSAYRHLPLNPQTAAIRLEELRNIMITAKPKEFQDTISDYLDWLADMADGHWRIYQAFSKVDTLKAQADMEKASTLKLGSLKRQALLLKAEFLIRNNRQPEALHPLIEIVTAEPRTTTGEAAYSMLKQIGFSEEAPLSAPTAIPSSSKSSTTL